MRFKKHGDLTIPSEDTRIWRYMDLAKYMDVIVHNRLFFSNVARLTDRYEGVVPETTLVQKREELKKAGLSERDLEEEVGRFHYLSMSMADISLASCWTIGDEESYALWKIYIGTAQYGVAVSSTVARLIRAIEKGCDPYPEDIYIGQVTYSSDLSEGELSRFKLLTRKMPFYAYESELRLLILNYPMSEGGTETPYPISVGRYVRIDVEELIDEVYISPFSGSWFHKTLESTLSKINPEIKQRLVTSKVMDE
jgi:hypothetical protein